MDEMEQKLGAILGNPGMMQQIQAMAQALGGSQGEEAGANSLLPGLAMGIDDRQQALLTALGPYLSRDRVDRLEKAMRAAKLARAASSFLGSGALQSLTGR